MGYAIKSVESIGILSETEAKAIAKDFGVPENLEVTYEQGFPTYWDAGGGYDFQFNVYHDNEIIAGGTLELESKEMWKEIYHDVFWRIINSKHMINLIKGRLVLQSKLRILRMRNFF